MTACLGGNVVEELETGLACYLLDGPSHANAIIASVSDILGPVAVVVEETTREVG